MQKQGFFNDFSHTSISGFMRGYVQSAYPPFGSPLIGRIYQTETSVKYRYSFNRQENDNEIYGKGNATTALFWEYDTRLGRRWNRDPIVKVWESSYSCFGNNPIFSVDLLGNNEGDYYSAETGQKLGSDGVNDDKSYIVETSKYNTSKESCKDCTPESLKNQLSSVSKEIPTNQVATYQRIITQYNTLVTDAISQGHATAAALLQHFLDGSGTTMKLSSSWLQKNSAVQGAVEKNHDRFEDEILDEYEYLAAGESSTIDNYWDAMATASVFSELYYCSGTFTVTSSASITLSRQENTVTVMGTETIVWHDRYDWHAGLGAFIPGHGNISDADALFLQKYGKAQPFNMESTWKRSLSGSISINDYWFDSSDFKWK